MPARFKSSCAERFIARARKKHGMKYNYSLVECENLFEFVKIICPEQNHGIFWQTAQSHAKGAGCPACGNLKRRQKHRIGYTTQKYIEESQRIHNYKYNYTLLNFRNFNNKLTIICPDHGLFEQMPSVHLDGMGCPKCGALISTLKRFPHIWKFTDLVRKKYGIQYTYDLTKFESIDKAICITCNLCHDSAEQTPLEHLTNAFCVNCRSARSNHEYAGIKLSEEELINNLEVFIESIEIREI